MNASETAREIAAFAIMTDQDCVICTQRTGGHWYIVVRRANGDERSFAVGSWNEAQHECAAAQRVIRTSVTGADR